MNCLFMNKFHSNYMITMEDIVGEGNDIFINQQRSKIPFSEEERNINLV